MKEIRKIEAGLRRADEAFNLIEDGDKIVVGVSGGKDSLSLIKALSIYQKYDKNKFEIYPVTMDLGFPSFNPTPIKEYVASLGMELIVEDASDICKILEQNRKKDGLLPCSICSRMRKAAINKVAHRLGCNKVAFAHHADDAIETKLLNEIYGGREATFSPMMHLERSDIIFIRPFVLLREKEIEKFVREEGIVPVASNCPNDKHTEREEVKKLLNQIYKEYPHAYENYLTCLMNGSKLDLYYDKFEVKITPEIVIKPVVSREQMIDFLDYVRENKIKITPKKEEREYFIHFKKEDVGVFTVKTTDNDVTISNIHVKGQLKKENVIDPLYWFFRRHFYPREVIVK